MSQLVRRAFTEPCRESPSFEERWKGPDRGLITCWEVGRELREQDPSLALRAARGELPPLAWKGGVPPETKAKKKYGTLNYLAQWQALRGENLDIDLANELELTCTRTGVHVTYTADASKWGQA